MALIVNGMGCKAFEEDACAAVLPVTNTCRTRFVAEESS